jgi:septation ring formation regulator EzrA
MSNEDLRSVIREVFDEKFAENRVYLEQLIAKTAEETKRYTDVQTDRLRDQLQGVAEIVRGHSHQFVEVRARLDTIDGRLERVEVRQDVLESRVTDLTTETRTGFDRVHAELASVRSEMRAGFDDIRAEMRVGFAEMRALMHHGFADVHVRLAALEGDRRR